MTISRALLPALALAPALWALPARAALEDLTLQPLTLPAGDAEFSIGGQAEGAGFGTSLPGTGGLDGTGEVKLLPRLSRDYDSGLSLSLNGTVAVRDALSPGRYDGKNLEELYGEMRFGLGRLDIGMIDGPSALAVAGPKAQADIALDDPEMVLLRDPGTGRAVNSLFIPRSSVTASSNYAKISFISPSILGLQLGFSFTPSESRDVLPFLKQGPQQPGRQVDIWEAALAYSDSFGPVTLSAYGGGAAGRAEHKLSGQVGVWDVASGLRADYPVNDDLTVSLGGAYRLTNAHAGDINQSWRGGDTSSVQLSTGATYGAWVSSLEYSGGVAGQVPGQPRLTVSGGEAALGYVFNPGIQLTGGWQHLAYGRGSGVFYAGAPRLDADIGFLQLQLKTTD